MSGLTIRPARTSDAPEIARLTAQLGYEVSAALATERLARLLSRPNQQFIIADVDGRAVGWLHAEITEYVDSGAFVIIAELVVDQDQRRRGIARALMEQAEVELLPHRCAPLLSGARVHEHQDAILVREIAGRDRSRRRPPVRPPR